MGDTGSLLLGFLFSALSINLLNIEASSGNQISIHLILSVLIIPVYDLLRVTVIRLITGNPPFQADRNHLHHMVLKQGFTQRGATIVLCLYNVVFIGFNYLLREFNINHALIITLCLALLLLNSKVVSHLATLHQKIFGSVRNGMKQQI
jgi:UDP-N-acetylmuramyl pentapeptide phosphotransferase/UDP-N-acetylglucosamine-1-phosphate transferase